MQNPEAPYVIAAYLVAAFGLGLLCAVSLWDAWQQARAAKLFEAKRRSRQVSTRGPAAAGQVQGEVAR